MTLASSLVNAARNLITTFGNDATLYSYSGATKTENEEGDITVTDWKTGTTVLVVDGNYVKEDLNNMTAGREAIGDDDKIIRDDVTIAVNDRLTYDGNEWQVVTIQPIRTQSTLVAQTIGVVRATSTTAW